MGRHGLSMVAVVSMLVSHGDAAAGDWRLEYPPWGETGLATSGSPRIWFPFIGPFTRHSCFPSRYMSARIAISHINRRDATFCPAIGTLKNKFEFAYDPADSNSNGIGSARAALKFLSNKSKKVSVILGPNGSGASMSMSNILAVFQIAHISWSATSGKLSNKAAYPMFFRVVSPDSLAMRVLAGWLHSLQRTTLNLAYFDADFQSGQVTDFLGPAKATYGMTVNVYKIPNSGPGGATVNAANMVHTKNALRAVRASGLRVIVAIAINEEANDFFRTAYDMQMVDGPGWMWVGTDGIMGGQLAGDVKRLKYFRGSVYIQPIGKGPKFPDFAKKWASLMPTTKRPEFDTMNLCVNKTANKNDICKGNPEFKGWKDGVHDVSLKCEGYTGLAYDAAVTLAIVADKMITKGKDPSKLTASDWLSEMRALSTPGVSFNCLTGKISFNKNQERDMPQGIFNWQLGSLVSTLVVTWDGVDGYKWVKGAKVVWPSGDGGTVTNAYNFSIPSGAPPKCARGSTYNNSVLNCQLCPLGTFETGGVGAGCLQCFAGKYQSKVGQTECANCVAGKFSDIRGLSKCKFCGIGTFQSSNVGKACDLCNVGYYQPKVGSSQCVRCAIGNYSSSPGSAKCLGCPPGKTTHFVGSVRASNCGCAEGTFLPVGEVGSCGCKTCPSGMTCKFGSEERKIAILVSRRGNLSRRLSKVQIDTEIAPMLNVGYFAKADEPLSVYQCGGPSADAICPGGLPGTCTHGRSALVCAQCPDDSVASGEICNKCSGLNKAVPALALLLLIPTPVIMYKFANSPIISNAPATLAASLAVGILVTVAQVLGLFGQLNVPWPSGIRSVYNAFGFLLGSPDSVTLECLVGQSPISNFAVQCSAPWIVLVMFLIVHGVSVFLPANVRFSPNKTFNSMGHLLQIVFIAVVGMASAPMQCFSHPNGMKSINQFPEVLCGEGDYNTLIVFSVILLLTLVLPFVVVSFWASWLAPQVAADSPHYVRFRYLMYRFRPDVWWWGLAFLMRQLLLGFAPMITPDDPGSQILYVVTILLIYITFQCFYCPWKTQELNVLDALSCCLLCMVIVTVGSFMEPSKFSGGHEIVMWIFMVSVCVLNMVLFVSVVGSAITYGIRGEFGMQYPRNKSLHDFGKEWHDVARSGAALSSEEWLQIFVSMNNFDRRLMDKAQGALKLSTFGRLGSNSSTPARLASCSKRKSKVTNGSTPEKPTPSATDVMSQLGNVLETVNSSNSANADRIQMLEAMLRSIQEDQSHWVPPEPPLPSPFALVDKGRGVSPRNFSAPEGGHTPRMKNMRTPPRTPRKDLIP